jgi:hypothetical protein
MPCSAAFCAERSLASGSHLPKFVASTSVIAALRKALSTCRAKQDVPAWTWRESMTDRRTTPRRHGPLRRDDISIIGSGASGLSSEDIGIIIVSPSSQDSQTAQLPLVATEDDSAVESTTKFVAKHNGVAMENRRQYLPSDRQFRPFVLSFAGMRETEARDALKLWKSFMTGGVYSLLFRRLSVGLLRVRARCFEP